MILKVYHKKGILNKKVDYFEDSISFLDQWFKNVEWLRYLATLVAKTGYLHNWQMPLLLLQSRKNNSITIGEVWPRETNDSYIIETVK